MSIWRRSGFVATLAIGMALSAVHGQEPIPISPDVTFTETFEGAGGFDNPGWTHTAVLGVNDWTLTTAQSQTPTHSWGSSTLASVSQRVLVSPPLQLQTGAVLTFWHTFDLESSVTPGVCLDGGTLETSIDGGTTWVVIPDAAITAGGFDGTVTATFNNPLAGKRAWCGNTVIGPFSQVQVNLSAFDGQTVLLRWNEGDDSSVARVGWFVDSITVTNVLTPVELQSFSVE